MKVVLSKERQKKKKNKTKQNETKKNKKTKQKEIIIRKCESFREGNELRLPSSTYNVISLPYLSDFCFLQLYSEIAPLFGLTLNANTGKCICAHNGN